MFIQRSTDLFLNILFPVLAGFVTYCDAVRNVLHPFFKDHLADACWAYALMSAILIIWDRNINKTWVLVTFLIATGFEHLQFIHVLPGTGDLIDVITYIIFFIITIILNSFFKSLFHYQNLNYEDN